MKLNKALVVAGTLAFLVGVAPYGVSLYIDHEAKDCIDIANIQGNGIDWTIYSRYEVSPHFPKIPFSEVQKKQAYIDTPASDRPAVISDYYSQAAGSYEYYAKGWGEAGIGFFVAGGIVAALGAAMELSKVLFKGWLYVVRETANAVRGK